MKVLCILLFCCLSANILPQEETNSYQINGNLKNLPAKLVYLRLKKDAPDKHAYWPIVDSAKVVNGKFTLKSDSSIAVPTEAVLFYIDPITKKAISFKYNTEVDRRKRDNFILENAKISVEGDILNTTGLILSGSKESDFLFKYTPMFLHANLIRIQAKIDSLTDAKNETALKSARKEYEVATEQFKKDFKQLIVNNKNTYTAVTVLLQNSMMFTLTELEELVTLFDKKVMDSPSSKMMLDYIKMRKFQQKKS